MPSPTSRAAAECAGRLRALAETLSLATAPDAPERGDEYGALVWAKLRAAARPRQSRRSNRRRSCPSGGGPGRSVAGFAALAAALVLAFLLGRRFPAEPQPLAAEVRERVLLVAVGEHLERSQMVLVELANAPAGEVLDVSAQRAVADELVTSGRLYREAAVRTGDPALVAVLEELERVLVEVAAGPAALQPADLERLQQRIESRGLLFKVRVVGTQGSRAGDGAPVAAGDDLLERKTSCHSPSCSPSPLSCRAPARAMPSRCLPTRPSVGSAGIPRRSRPGGRAPRADERKAARGRALRRGHRGARRGRLGPRGHPLPRGGGDEGPARRRGALLVGLRERKAGPERRGARDARGAAPRLPAEPLAQGGEVRSSWRSASARASRRGPRTSRTKTSS